MSWYAIHCKPQQEKKVALGLEKIGIESYCPMISEIRQWSDRKKEVALPLIKSYVFVNIDHNDRNKVFKISGVLRYLFWLGKSAVIPDNEIILLRKTLSNKYRAIKVSNFTLAQQYTITAADLDNKKFDVIKTETKCIKVKMDQIGVLISIY